MKKGSKLLLALAACLLLGRCKNYDGIEVIVVNKIPRGAFSGEGRAEEFYNTGWYIIGLSRNGEEPIEYIWRAEEEPGSYFIRQAEIGDRGTIHFYVWEKQIGRRLPRPNAKKPPVIGALGEVYWEKRE
jgi:hypothetical protein